MSAAPLTAAPTPLSPAERLARARALYDAMEYDQVGQLLTPVLADTTTSPAERQAALVLHGSNLAVLGDTVEAEVPFRTLLRDDGRFNLPSDTPPKIMAVFRKVQVEEETLRQAELERRRQTIISQLKLEIRAETPQQIAGGVPIPFAYRLLDPSGQVSQMTLQFKPAGTAAFTSIPFTRQDDDLWAGEIPAELTANDDGMTLEYYVETSDDQSLKLLSLGAPNAPLRISVTPGQVERAVPFYRTYWFWTVIGVAVTGAAVGGGLWYHASLQAPTSDLPNVIID